jgi:CelD/BcsL family acetyltransferase involved in cellulose biosynthesis
MLLVEEIRSLAEFGRIRGEWQDLQNRAGASSVLLSHGWLEVCAASLAVDQQLLILLVREEGRLVGAAPFVKQKSHIRRMPIREIRFLQTPLTPFIDFLFVNPQTGLRAITAHFRKSHTDWDVLSFQKLREDSPHLAPLRDLLQREKWTRQESTVARTPILHIEKSWEDFYKEKSPKFRKTRRSITNKLERLGTITIEQVTRPEDAERGLEQMLRVSERSWTRKQGADLLSETFEREFFRALTKVASHARYLRIWLLKKNEEVVAAEYHIEDHGTVYGLRAHYDPEYSSSSPGSYLDTRIVQHLFQNGYSVYDMGPGMVGYKLAWTDDFYQCEGISVYNSGPYSQFLARLETRWIPALKRSAVGRWFKKTQEDKESKAKNSEGETNTQD